MHISKVSKSFNEEVSFLFNDDNLLTQFLQEETHGRIIRLVNLN